MTKAAAEVPDFYYVPFGRDRGGLLEVLGLPPDATAAQVDTALADYRTRLETNMRAERKVYRQRKDASEMTLEEFEKIKDELQQKVDARIAELNDLRRPYDNLQAERRRLKHAGASLRDEVIWQRMYPAVDDVAGLLQLIAGLKHGPLRQLSEAELQERLTAWMSPGRLLVSDPDGTSPGLAWSALGLITEESQSADEIDGLFDLVVQSFQDELVNDTRAEHDSATPRSDPGDGNEATRWINQERQLLRALLESIGLAPPRLLAELELPPDAPGRQVRQALAARRAAVRRDLYELLSEAREQVERGETTPEAFEKWQQDWTAAGAAWTDYFDSLLVGWERSQSSDSRVRDQAEPRALAAVNDLIADHQTAYSVLTGPSVISRLTEIARDSRLQTLLAADALWSALNGTNREHWRSELERAVTALESGRLADGPLESPPSAPRISLHDGYVAQLPWGEVEEASAPTRGAAFGQELGGLRGLLARLGMGGNGPGGSDPQAELARLEAELEELLGCKLGESSAGT